MNTSTAARHVKKKEDSREVGFADFWAFTIERICLNDSDRLLQIKEGFPAHLVQAVRSTFYLQDRSIEALLNASISTLDRRRREQRNLDPVASERLDRIAAVCNLAEEVFESKEAASQWMSKPNKALGGSAPIMHCDTEIGAKQVRRVLQALEYGGAA